MLNQAYLNYETSLKSHLKNNEELFIQFYEQGRRDGARLQAANCKMADNWGAGNWRFIYGFMPHNKAAVVAINDAFNSIIYAQQIYGMEEIN